MAFRPFGSADPLSFDNIDVLESRFAKSQPRSAPRPRLRYRACRSERIRSATHMAHGRASFLRCEASPPTLRTSVDQALADATKFQSRLLLAPIGNMVLTGARRPSASSETFW